MNFYPGDPVVVRSDVVLAFNEYFGPEGIPAINADTKLTILSVHNDIVDLIEIKRNKHTQFDKGWFRIDDNRSRPKFHAGDKVRTPYETWGGDRDNITISGWYDLLPYGEKGIHRYIIESEGLNNVGPYGENWFEPLSDKQLIAVGLTKQLTKHYNLEATAKAAQYSNITIYHNVLDLEEEPSWSNKALQPRYSSYLCRWCHMPITRCTMGEFKGHWQHVDAQEHWNPTNRWNCAPSRTSDGMAHICEIDLEYKANQGWTAEPVLESNLPMLLPTGRKFKG